MTRFSPTKRKAERNAYCRACDGLITKGEPMISMYFIRNRGQNIHFHIDCVKQMEKLTTKETNE